MKAISYLILIILTIISCKTSEVFKCDYEDKKTRYQAAQTEYFRDASPANCEAVKNAALGFQRALEGCDDYSRYANQLNEYIESSCTQTPVIKTGQASFWMAADPGCGAITVNVDNKTANITGFHPNGISVCGTTGNATFTLAPGTYTYTAACTGESWSGEVTVIADGCTSVKLEPKLPVSGIFLLSETTDIKFTNGQMTGDKEGNIYGVSYSSPAKIRKFNSQGTLIWEKDLGNTAPSGYDMFTSWAGDVYMAFTSSEGNNFLGTNVTRTGHQLANISETGTSMWVKRLYSGLRPNINFNRWNSAIDSKGNIYACFNDGNNSIILVKYNSDGDIIWEKSFSGPFPIIVGYSKIALDGADNIYLSGVFVGELTLGDFTITANSVGGYIAKVDTDGNVKWLNNISPNKERDGYLVLRHTTSGGDSYCLFHSYSNDGILYFVKYNSKGELLWTRKLDEKVNYPNLPYPSYQIQYSPSTNFSGIAVDQAGNIYLSGRLSLAPGASASPGYLSDLIIKYDGITLNRQSDGCAYIMKYDSNGNPLGIQSFGGNPLSFVEIYSLVSNVTGKVFMSGYLGGYAGAEMKFNNAVLKTDDDWITPKVFLARVQF